MPKKLTEKRFIEKCEEIYGDAFDYSKVEYINNRTKVCIICPIHGEFYIRPSDFLNGHQCQKCSGVKKLTTEEFIAKANKKHGNKYDYTKVRYTNNKTKVCIICPVHNEFLQRPNDHLTGYGCPKCAKNYIPTITEWINKAKYVHGNVYDYSKAQYKGSHKKLCIICPTHGEFWQEPNNHLNGCGCPNCNVTNKSKMESNISIMLKEHKIQFEAQKTFNWLKYKKNLYLDYYLPKYNIAIECQGEQHYKSIKRFGGNDGLKIRRKRDDCKKILCDEHGIKIFYITKANYNINDVIEYINHYETANKNCT